MNRHHHSAGLKSLAAVIFPLSFGQDNFTLMTYANSPEDPGPPLVASLEADGTHEQNLVACAPDGAFFVLARPDGRLRYIRTADGRTLRTFYQCHPRAVAFSPDGHFLGTAGAAVGKPGKIKVWRLGDGALVCQIQAELAAKPQLHFSHDGHWLAGVGSDSRLLLWELPGGTLKQSAIVRGDVIRTAFTEGGRAFVAICADGSVTHCRVP